MILLSIASIALFLITYFTGFAFIQLINRFFKIQTVTDFFETFVFGLVASFIYFNLLSFFTAVNYFTLLPLLPAAASGYKLYSRRFNFNKQVNGILHLLFAGKTICFTLPFFLLLFVYWIIPSYNPDSGEYHYTAIRWYEQYKVIPGLANIHGRLAFNPANFIISAAWSFTNLAGQALYPLNGVLIAVFYTWMLKKIISGVYGNLFSWVLLACCIVLFRTTLVNISSPSSDLLPGLLLFYCGLRMYELLKLQVKEIAPFLPVVLFSCFAVSAKLVAVPALLLLPFIFFTIRKEQRTGSHFLKTSLLLALVILPWLTRNIIMTGYLLYPVPGSNFGGLDWTAPAHVVKLDYIFSKYGPIARKADLALLQKTNSLQLRWIWLTSMYTYMRFSLLIALAGFASVFLWLAVWRLQKKIAGPVLLLWLIYYTCIWIWLFNSPTLRFGLSYVVLCVAMPFFELAYNRNIKSYFYFPPMVAALLVCLFYYTASSLQKKRFRGGSLTSVWLKPLRDMRYYRKNDIASFPKVDLGNGVTLYYADKDHECLNANGPCVPWKYGIVEMRGKKIEEGFRIKKDEVQKYYPFVSP